MDMHKYETMIEQLQLQNMELQNKVNVLYKLCENLEEYINKHNLFELKVELSNMNGKQINNLLEFENMMYLKIPKAVYLVDNKPKKE